MWKKWDPSDILERLDTLESIQKAGQITHEDISNRLLDAERETQDWKELHATLRSVRLEIDALRATSEDFKKDQDAISRKLVEMTLAIGEGIERVARDERRIRAAVTRAQKRLAELGLEDAGVDAEAGELDRGDAEGGGGVPAVPAEVANDGEDPSGIPGVTMSQLRYARGM